jgi:hypothetical protein
MAQEQLSTTRQNLLGHTQLTDHLTQSKSALAEQMKFLAAKVDREFVQVQRIQKSTDSGMYKLPMKHPGRVRLGEECCQRVFCIGISVR